MTTIRLIINSSACAVALLAIGNSTLQAQNLLSDPGFESGTPVPSGVGGWQTFNGAVFSTAEAYTGVYSMLLSGPGGYTVPGSVEFFASSPGAEYDLTGYGFLASPISGTGAGFVQISFFSGPNGTGTDLGTVETPGNALTSNKLTSSSPTGTWTLLDTGIAEAPAGTESVGAYTLVLDPSTTTTAYFDDLSFVTVPEPSSCALASMGVGAFFLWRRQRN